MRSKSEVFISVDIEASGPIPGEYSMLTLGACVIDQEDKVFEMCLKPISNKVDPDALSVTGLSIQELEKNGQTPQDGMQEFAQWIKLNSDHAKPVFVGLNAGFDWSFVNYYFHRYLGHNPFGFSALDIKALYMGATNVAWSETSARAIARQFQIKNKGTHIALEDALYQAALFKAIRGYMRRLASA